MRELRTTVTNRLVRRGRWSAAGRFRGVIAPMLSKSGLFRPVARDYRKLKQEFALVNKRQRRKAGAIAFTISPTIQLTCISRNTDNTDFYFDSTRIFQTLQIRDSQHTDRSLFEKTGILQTLKVEHSQRAGIVNDRVSREFSFAKHTRVRELLSSLFSTFGSTLRRSFPAKAQRREEVTEFLLGAFAPLREKSFVTTGTRNEVTRISALKLFTNQCASSNTTNLHQRHDNWLLLRSRNVAVDDERHITRNDFTTLTLNFAAPKASDTELIQQRIAHFISVPALTYAKRQQAASDGIVQALRELRITDPEPKRIAAPVLPSIEQLTSQVKTQLERELRIERERRGL